MHSIRCRRMDAKHNGDKSLNTKNPKWSLFQTGWMTSMFSACKESRVRQPGASGFCDRASEFCALLARRASEDFSEN